MASLKQKYEDLMANFDKGQLVGVDIGLSAVKVALLSPRPKNRFRLDHFAAIPLSEAAIIEDEIQKPDEIVDALKQALKDARIKPRICNLGMDGPNTMTKRMQVPDGSSEDIEDNILWESEQYIPFGADESEVDFAILGKIREEDVVDAIVAAAKTSVVENFIEVLNEAGLKTRKVDLNIFAINNLFELWAGDRLPEYSEAGTIIIDFGAQTTSILVYKNGGPVLTKEIPVGGVLITEEIQRQMGVSYEEAEDLKLSQDDKGNLPEEILSIIELQTQGQMDEIRKVLNFFIAAGSSEQAGFCFVTGGNSLLPGLIPALQDLVGVEVEMITLFDCIEYEKKAFNEDSLELINATGMVALGLGLRKV